MKKDKLRVLTYNIAWLQGEGSEGVGYKKKSKLHFESGISCIYQIIKDNAIDIACLQEIDFKSKKSHFIDQFDRLKNKLDYFGEKIVSWDIPYLPFPYFNHWGKVVSGGAILSSIKIKTIAHHFFNAPQNMFFLKRLFYLNRYVQITKIKFKNKNEYIFNLHLEAFDFEAKKEQLLFLHSLIKEYNPIMICGDFNTIPKGSNTKVDIDYSDDPCIELLPHLMENYQDIFKDTFTFPTGKENCRLDYIWVRSGFNVEKINLKYVFNPSDHIPIGLEIS
jgi:endonuclease/exonuclease/phosphatase family metal-dependent hydrolase